MTMTTTSPKKRSRKRAQTRSRTNPDAHAEEASDVGEVSQKALIPPKSTALEKTEGGGKRMAHLGVRLGGLGLAALVGLFAWRSKALRPMLRTALATFGPNVLRTAYARVTAR